MNEIYSKPCDCVLGWNIYIIGKCTHQHAFFGYTLAYREMLVLFPFYQHEA